MNKQENVIYMAIIFRKNGQMLIFNELNKQNKTHFAQQSIHVSHISEEK